MKLEDLPFPIGSTYADGGTPSAADAPQLEGKEYLVECTNPNSGGIVDPFLTGAYKRVRIVRNINATAALPKTIQKMNLGGSGKEYLSQTDGVADTVGQVGYPVDEFLPAAGAAQYDLYYIVIDGLAKVISAGAGDTTISIGSMVIPSTSGHVIDQDTTVAAGAATFNQIQGAIGRAVTAVAAINTDFYIKVTQRG